MQALQTLSPHPHPFGEKSINERAFKKKGVMVKITRHHARKAARGLFTPRPKLNGSGIGLMC